MVTLQAPVRQLHEQSVRAAIYCRKSNDDNLDAEYNSLDAQRDICEGFIQQHTVDSWVVVPQHYDDGGFSGGTLQRPALHRLLRDIERGLIDMVVVYRWDRLSRSSRDFNTLIDLLDRHSVSCLAVTQPMDTSNAMGRFTQTLMMGVAQLEREMAAERIRDKVAAAKRKGLYTGGPPVLGYDVDHQRKALVVNPTEAALVQDIFARFIRDGSPTRLAEQLNAEGKTTKAYTTVKGAVHHGYPWNKMHIYRLLNNPLYLGQVTHKGERFPGVHEAVITQEQWDQVHRILEINCHVRAKRTRAKTPALLKGLIRCGHCGTAMGVTFTQKPNKQYRYYLCINASKMGYQRCPVGTVAAGMVEEAVVNQLRAVFRSQELAAATFRSALGMVESEGGKTITGFRERDVVEALGRIDPIWDALFPAEQARIVQLLVQQVTVREDGIDIALRVDGLHSLVTELHEIAEEYDAHV